MRNITRFSSMKKVGMILITFICIASLFTGHICESEENEIAEPNIILFSWDGLQRNHLFDLLSDDRLPNLKAFLEEGVMLNLTVVAHNTQTKPGHGQMLSGYRGKHIGVYNNSLLIHPIPDGYTLFERIEEYYGGENVVTSMITGKLKHIGPVFENAVHDIDTVSIESEGNIYVGIKMINFIEENKDKHFVSFFHFKEPDELGHDYGENSMEYDMGVIEDDLWFGNIINKLDELNLLNNTIIYVTTDHGFEENTTRHKWDTDTWLATNDLRLNVNTNETRGSIIDIVPTIFYSLEINYQEFDPPLKGFPLQAPLPIEVGSRTNILLDSESPIITLGNDAPIYFTDESKINISFNVTDKNLEVCYIMVNGRMDEKYTHYEEIIYNNTMIRQMQIEYDYTIPVYGYEFQFEILSFDERENIGYKKFNAISDLNQEINNAELEIMDRILLFLKDNYLYILLEMLVIYSMYLTYKNYKIEKQLENRTNISSEDY